MELEYTTKIFNSKQFNKWALLNVLVAMSILFGGLFVAIMVKDRFPPIAVMILFCVIAAFVSVGIQNRIKILCTRNVKIKFTDESMTLTEIKGGDENIISQNCIYWHDLDSYRFSVKGKNFTLNYIHLFFKSGKKKILAFVEDYNSLESALDDEASLFRNFYTFIKNYNNNHPAEPVVIRRQLMPAILYKTILIASGLTALIGLVLLAINGGKLAALPFAFGTSTFFTFLLINYNFSKDLALMNQLD